MHITTRSISISIPKTSSSRRLCPHIRIRLYHRHPARLLLYPLRFPTTCRLQRIPFCAPQMFRTSAIIHIGISVTITRVIVSCVVHISAIASILVIMNVAAIAIVIDIGMSMSMSIIIGSGATCCEV